MSGTRVIIRVEAYKPECDSCPVAKTKRIELARQVDSGDTDIDSATDDYKSFVLRCSGLRVNSIRMSDTVAGQVILSAIDSAVTESPEHSDELRGIASQTRATLARELICMNPEVVDTW